MPSMTGPLNHADSVHALSAVMVNCPRTEQVEAAIARLPKLRTNYTDWNVISARRSYLIHACGAIVKHGDSWVLVQFGEIYKSWENRGPTGRFPVWCRPMASLARVVGVDGAESVVFCREK